MRITSTFSRAVAEAIWVEREAHSAEMLIGPTHVIQVEVKSAR